MIKTNKPSLQSRTSIKHSWNTLDSFLESFLKHTWKCLEISLNMFEAPLNYPSNFSMSPWSTFDYLRKLHISIFRLEWNVSFPIRWNELLHSGPNNMFIPWMQIRKITLGVHFGFWMGDHVVGCFSYIPSIDVLQPQYQSRAQLYTSGHKYELALSQTSPPLF